jgi:hypothetical protein
MSIKVSLCEKKYLAFASVVNIATAKAGDDTKKTRFMS